MFGASEASHKLKLNLINSLTAKKTGEKENVTF